MKPGGKLPDDQAEIVFSDWFADQLEHLPETERVNILGQVVDLCEDPGGTHTLSARGRDRVLVGWNTLEVSERERRVVYHVDAAGASIFVLCLGPRRGSEVYDMATALANVSDTYTTSGTPGVELATTQDATTAKNTNANANITLLETALDKVGELRSLFGANINRLNHTANNLSNMKDNLDASKGRILDADFAQESANMTKNSMLLQSGISMLKQAGQMPGMVMSLLG